MTILCRALSRDDFEDYHGVFKFWIRSGPNFKIDIEVNPTPTPSVRGKGRRVASVLLFQSCTGVLSETLQGQALQRSNGAYKVLKPRGAGLAEVHGLALPRYDYLGVGSATFRTLFI